MKNRKIRFLSAEDLQKTLSMAEAIRAVKDAFLQLSNGRAIVPLRTPMELTDRDGGALFMPVYLPESEQIGLKAVSVFAANPRKGLPVIHALFLIMDGRDGRPLAVMDGEFLTALRTGAASGLATDLLAKTAALDGSLIRWPFYDDLWRQMLLCFRGQSPPVHLSGLSAPDECVITVPRRISMEYEIGNVSKQRADMAVHVDFTRNGLPVPNLHSEAQFKVSPGQNVGQQTKTTLDAARGAYEYVVSLRDAKGQVLDARDGTFLALPETFLTIDLFALHGFASDHAIPIRIFVSNINQAKRLVVKADVRDQGGRPIAAMKDTLLENPSLAKMAIEQEIAPHQLRPATYALHATLYGGKKLADKLDAATATFTVHSPLPSSRFPIFLDGIDPGDDAHASAQWDRAKALGVSGVVLTPHTGPCAALRTLADERRLAMLRAAQDRDLAVIDGSGQAADAFRIGCAPSVAADGLPAAVVQALRDYEAQARLMHNLAGVSVTPRRVPTSPAVSDACRGLFRQKFGYDMPGPEVPDRYYYARRFLGDASGGIVDRIRSGLQSEGHALPIAAVIDPQTYFAGMHDPVHFVPAFDVVALAAQSPARIERLWLDMLAAPSIRGKADVWACVHIAPGPGTSWTPRTASAQAYQALGRGAAGLVLAKQCPKGKAVVINMSGRGDKDLFIAARELAGDSWAEFLKAEVKRCESE